MITPCPLSLRGVALVPSCRQSSVGSVRLTSRGGGGGAPTLSLGIDCETDPESGSGDRRAVILKPLYSEAVGHL